MEDRRVTQLDPQPAPNADEKLFSFYSDYANLVLLGNPGAGKTHLFRYFASHSDAGYVTARDFLNLPVSEICSGTLFIDALDEKRAGRGDGNTIDSMVAKLFEVRPKKVRISCRAADWLGNTDLDAFRAYFDRSGGAAVIQLESLSESEQIAVVESQGIESPVTFLGDAKRKGLEGFLSNPQSLKMLCEVVRKGDWPQTKRELFESSVDVLLSEHNAKHSDSARGRFSSIELVRAAGGLCAARLISDVAGIGLSDAYSDEDHPYFRELKVDQNDRMETALCRRVFVSGPRASTVDYGHRTIAEYLAAHWLAMKIREGLPLGRVLALIGVDRHPATELRGLHAWLPVFLPEHAQELIDQDPLGVLYYGDAASLGPTIRKHLLVALEHLAEKDPWFHNGRGSGEMAASLSGLDMEKEFGSILANPTSPYSLRSIVLDALCAGAPIPALTNVLTSIAIDPERSYAERQSSVEALARLDAHNGPQIEVLFAKIGTRNPDDIRMRAEMLTGPYSIGSRSMRVAELLNATLEIDQKVPTGAFWHLADVVPIQEIPQVLDSLGIARKESAEGSDRLGAMDVLRVVDQLLVRFIQKHTEPNAERLLRWLHTRLRLASGYGYSPHTTEELRGTLAGSHISSQLVDAAVPSWGTADKQLWGDAFEFDRATLSAIRKETLLERIISEVVASQDERSRSFYGHAFHLVWQIGSTAYFERVYALADERGVLGQVRVACCYSPIPDWRWENYERMEASTAKSRETKQKNQSKFEADRDQIEAGCHYTWLAWIGQAYYALLSNVDRKATPSQRLITELGEERTLVALRGLSSLLKTGKITPMSEVIRMNTDRKQYTWWYAILAAMDLEVHTVDDLNLLSPDYLQSALAIDCFHPTFVYEENVQRQRDYEWKVALLESRPVLAADVYLAIARNDVLSKKEYPDGVHQLMKTPALSDYRSEYAERLLNEFPSIEPRSLTLLLTAMLETDNFVALTNLVENALEACQIQGARDAYLSWLAAGFLVSPNTYLPKIDALDESEARKMIWELRDLSGRPRRVGRGSVVTPGQLFYMISLTARHFPPTPYPVGGWSGDRNPWDANRLVENMINQLSDSADQEAPELLARLASSPDLTAYGDYVRHALAEQKIRRIDVLYEQPTWRQAIATLMNAEPANVADLHALLCAHMDDLKRRIATINTDIFKRFWNEDSYGRIETPKSEESARDVLVDELRLKVLPQHVAVEPEGHMANDKRADIVAILSPMKVVVELKRDRHGEVWTAIQEQLERFYTRDIDAQGFGIYGVFWYGSKCLGTIPHPPHEWPVPSTPKQMEEQLNSLVPSDKRAKIKVFVIDVSGHVP